MNAAPHWLVALRVYLVTTVAAHLIWEVVQLPLYTIWRSGTSREIAFAVLHCTIGDLMIATLSLMLALVCLGGGENISYEKGRGVAEDEGVLEAAFDGNHGWFWRNRTDAPVTVTLKTSGAYSDIKRVL